MGCNCGDNEYNIEIENNGSCEPTTPIYNISLGGVGVDGYSPTVEFINQTDSQFQIRVNDVNGTVISNAVPKLSFLIDNYVSNSVLASTLTAYSTTAEINTILEDYVTNSTLSTTLEDYATLIDVTDAINNYDTNRVANTYLKKDGSNADSTINLNKLRLITNNNSYQRITTGSTQTSLWIDGYGLTLTGSAYNSQVNPHTFYIAPSGSSIEIGNLASNQIVIDNTSARYNGNEIATVNDIPDITTKLNANGSNADAQFTVNGVELYNNSVYMSNINYGSVHLTQINSNIYNSLGVDSDRAYLSMPSLTLNSYPYPNTRTLLATTNDFYINTNGGKVYYNNNEVATVNQIPTVNDSTITFTQGGVTKGTITLNQSGDQTIALDAGGGGGGSYTAGNGIDITNNEISIDDTVVATQIWVGNQGYLTGITGTNVINALGYTPMAQQGSSYNGNITITANGNNTTMSLSGGRSGITLSNTGVNITPYSNNTLKVNNKPVLINDATGTGSLAILGAATASNAIQIGSGANSTANSLQVGSYSLLNTNTGYIVGARIPIDGTSITLNNSGQLQSFSGISIDDNTPSSSTVYSSQKTQDLIDALVARIVVLETNINGGNA